MPISSVSSAPSNVALGNSAGYNYASGRLDHQVYFKALRVQQAMYARCVLDRIFHAWLREALLVPGLSAQAWTHLQALSGLLKFWTANCGMLPDRIHRDDLWVAADWLEEQGSSAAIAARRWAAAAETAGTEMISVVPRQWFWDGNEHVDPQKESNAQATRLISHTTTLAEEYAKRGKDWEVELRQRAREITLMQELGLAAVAPASPEDDSEKDDDVDDDETKTAA